MARREGDVFADLLTPDDTREGVEPASTVYCDDFMQIATPQWVDLLVQVGALVFELMNVREKVLKLEGPSKCLQLLGKMFDVNTGLLLVPLNRANEICALIQSILTLGDNRQSISYQELASVVRRLTWAGTGVELGRAYLRDIRRQLVAVMELLKTRKAQEQFCVPLYKFEEATAELLWWFAALSLNWGGQLWQVGKDRKFHSFRWTAKHGEVVDIDIVQFGTDASLWGGGGVYKGDWV